MQLSRRNHTYLNDFLHLGDLRIPCLSLLEMEFEGTLNNKQGELCSREASPLDGKKGCLEKHGHGVKIEECILHIGERG